MEEVRWKSDKKCAECKEEMRKQIIREIQQTVGCRKCSKFKRISRRDLEKRDYK